MTATSRRNNLPTLLLEVRRTLKPGDPGTHKLVERFGGQLVCVRYRLDPDTRVRMTTVELVVDTALAAPRRRRPAPAPISEIEVTVYVRVGFEETEVRQRVKAAGGRWDPERKVWALPRRDVDRLGLADRIVRGIDPQKY